MFPTAEIACHFVSATVQTKVILSPFLVDVAVPAIGEEVSPKVIVWPAFARNCHC